MLSLNSSIRVAIVFFIIGSASCQKYQPWSVWTKCSVTCGVGTMQRQRRCADGSCIERQTKGCLQKDCEGAAEGSQFKEWESWSPCSKSCGDGVQERQRKCTNDRCLEKQTKSCRIRTCPEDIEGWSEWSRCSATCGQGIARRERRCAVGSCIQRQTKTCSSKTCPSGSGGDTFTAWENWSSCSKTCGQGERRRSRSCRIGTCRENAVQTCSVKPCDGEVLSGIVLGEWQKWQKCSVTCGTGTRRRIRNCVVGVCEQTQTSSCRLEVCPGGSSSQNKEYEEWGPWEPCSVTCGVGLERRVRKCVVGLCQEVMRKTCLKPSCPGTTREDNFLPWTAWGECSESCGGGERRRSRGCKAPAKCVENQAQTCNVQRCTTSTENRYSQWSAWSKCSASCGSGESKRTRTSVANGPTQQQLKGCVLKPCDRGDDKYSNWQSWSGCSVTCGTGISTRVRPCKVGTCQDAQTKPCTLQECKTINLEDKYGPWQAWSACSKTCGFGISKRQRFCRVGNCNQTSSKTCRLGACPTDYTEWEDWGRCSVTCGPGTATRKRFCTVGVCEEKQHTPCDMPKCADGWEDWSEWQGCHKTCGSGFDYRRRRCVESLPSEKCPGDDRDFRECNTQPCESDLGVWGPWNNWGECSENCGSGVSVRKRDCTGTGDCEGDDEETEACNTDDCLKARWSNWSVWSDCTASCGNGERARTRICINGKQWDEGCFGSNLDKEPCTQPPCISARWSKWSPWRPCTASCGEGTTNRERVCIGGAPNDPGCEGSSSETNKCEEGPCVTVSEWGDWGPWSACSATCGKGISSMKRVCNTGTNCEGVDEEKRECETESCTKKSGKWGEWLDWTECTASCGIGTTYRERTCDSPGNNCSGPKLDTKTCTKEDCSAKWGEWQLWSMCSKTCGDGLAIRTRVCIGGSIGDKGCNEGGSETKDCSDGPCDGEDTTTKWSLWSNWSECPVSCGYGVESRSRICSSPGLCSGEGEEVRQCERPPCQKAMGRAGVDIDDPSSKDAPWYVIILQERKNILMESNEAKLGGGSLINDRWVLTAAHAIESLSQTNPTSAILALGITAEISGGASIPSHAQIYRAGTILIHPKFNERTYDHDIALVKVGDLLKVSGNDLVSDPLGGAGPVEIDNHISPVSLPCISACDHATNAQENGIRIAPYNRRRCQKYARNIKSTDNPDMALFEFGNKDSGGLHSYDMQLQNGETCKSAMKEIRKTHRRARFTPRNLCTDKNPPPQPCEGSAGDPLVKQVQLSDANKCWVQVGLFTKNWSCSSSKVQYYTDVTHLILWISKAMK